MLGKSQKSQKITIIFTDTRNINKISPNTNTKICLENQKGYEISYSDFGQANRSINVRKEEH